MCWLVGVVLMSIWMGESKMILVYNSTGQHVFSSDTPIPFNSVYLSNTTISLVVDNLRGKERNMSGLDYILLCNITIRYSELDHDCDGDILKNAKLVISFPPYFLNAPGRTYFYFPSPPVLPPVIEMKRNDYLLMVHLLSSSNWTLNMTVHPSHYNAWIEAAYSALFVFCQVVICLVSFVSVVGAIYCLVLIQKAHFPQLSHIILILEIIANTQRFFYFAIDPLISRNIFSFNSGATQETLSLPFSLSASLLIGVFWYTLVKTKMQKLNGLLPRRMVIPCLVVVAFICFIEIAHGVVRGVLPFGPVEKTFTFVQQIVYGAISVATFIFYIYTGLLLFKTLKRVNVHNPMIEKIRLLLSILVVLTLILLVDCVGFITPLYETPAGYFGVWFLGHFVFGFQGIVHVIAFLPTNTPKQPKESSPKETSSPQSNPSLLTQ